MRLIIAWFILLSVFTLAQAQSLPSLAPAGFRGLTPHEEKQLGEQFYAYMQARGHLLQDLLVTDYLNQLGLRLASASNRPNQHFLFFVVKDHRINAFAGPNGYIGVNTGLILFAKTEGELAAVLAHEIAHVTQRHIAQSLEAANRGILPTAAAAIAGILTGNPAIAVGAMGANAQNQLRFTRAHEREADYQGTKTLQRAGFDPNDTAKMFAHMQRASYDSIGQRIEFLSSHPLTENRIAKAQNQTTFLKTTQHKSSLHFYLVQARLATSLSQDPKQTLVNFKAALSKTPNDAVLQYATALAFGMNHQLKPAKKYLQQLIQKTPDEIFYPLSLAQLEANEGQYSQALTLLKNQLAEYPNYYPLIMQTAQTLLQAKHTQQAIRFMKPYLRSYSKNILFLDVYQRALGTAGLTAAAYRVRAKILILFKQPKLAVQQLKLALQQKSLSHFEKQQIEAEIKQYQKMVKQSRHDR